MMINLSRVQRNRLIFIGRLMASVGLMAYIVSLSSIDEWKYLINNISSSWVFLGFLLTTGSLCLGGINLYLFYWAPRRGQVGKAQFFKAFFVSQSLSLWLPGKLGDLTISHMLQRSIPLSDSLLYVIMDKLISFFATLFCAVIGFILYGNYGTDWFLLFVIFVVLCFSVFISFNTRVHEFIVDRFRGRLKEKIEQVLKTLMYFKHHNRRIVLVNLIISFVRLAAATYALLFLLRGVQSDVPFTPVFFTTSVAFLSSLIPLTVQGIGVSEGICIFFLGPFGVGTAEIIFCGVAGRLINIVGIFLMHSFFEGKKIESFSAG
ncbi:MAG: flippase-like domain-containing protein [Magnetococcales bacterium]|nr:flippase-like domain-containing protein [Magnetococcales bacterium]